MLIYLFQEKSEKQRGVSVCSLCTEPWDNSPLRTGFLCWHPVKLMNMSLTYDQNQVIKGCFWVTETETHKLGHHTCTQAPYLETLTICRGADGEHKGDTCCPPQSLEMMVFDL